MKTRINLLCTAILLAGSVWLSAGESATQHSPAFDRLKTLVGTWKGKVDMGQGPIDMAVQYRLIAGGSVLEERVFQGTPNEMVTMYYEKDGQVALTHYCVMGNRPAMTLSSGDSKTLVFDFDNSCGISPKEPHMHALKITFDDQDTVTTSCKSVIDGKATEGHPTVLKRVKS